MNKLNSTLMILGLVFLSYCNKETEDKPQGDIRVAVRLYVQEIPILEGATETEGGERPWLWKMGWNGDNYDFVKYFYSWSLSDTNFVNLDMVVTESHDQTLRYLKEKREASSSPIDNLKYEDQPTIAGDKSFGQGRIFIRNNIVIEIYPQGIYTNRIEKLARQIDKIILEGPNFFSISEVKPIIKNLSITKNPVIERTKTKIELVVTDPKDKKIYYQWDFKTIGGLGGNIVQDSGTFFYEANSTYTDVGTNKEELTLVIINEFGFFSDSTITITTIKE